MKKRIWLLTLGLVIMMSTCAFAGEWVEDICGMMYLEDDGTFTAATWKEIDGKWYFFGGDWGAMTNQWVGQYYLGEDGAMLTNSYTPDGYYVGADGVRVGNPVDPADTSAYVGVWKKNDSPILVYITDWPGEAGSLSLENDTSGATFKIIPTDNPGFFTDVLGDVYYLFSGNTLTEVNAQNNVRFTKVG